MWEDHLATPYSPTKASAAVPRDVQKKIAEHNKSPLTWDSMEKVKIVAMDQSSYSWDSSAQNGTVALYLKLPDDIEKAEQVKCNRLGHAFFLYSFCSKS